MENELSRGGAINDIRRKTHMVRTCSTVEKQAERMPNTSVETTILKDVLRKKNLSKAKHFDVFDECVFFPKYFHNV